MRLRLPLTRRQFLATGFVGITAGLAGCQRTPDGSGIKSDSLRINGVYANDIDRKFLDGEYFVLQNTHSDSVNVSGYSVESSTGFSHKITHLVLEPGAKVAFLTRAGEDTVLQTSPPLYLRYLADDRPPLLEKNGTVRVRDRNGDIVAETCYQDFGRDPRNETSDEVECIE